MGALREFGYLCSAVPRSLRDKGVAPTAAAARDYLADNIFKSRADFTQQRFRLSEQLGRQLDYTVAYGPFAGLTLNRESWWSAADRGTMLLGLYEQEVLQALESAPRSFDTLIDVGAADGYYAIGCLKAGWVNHAYCYEESEAGQQVILSNARANGVAGQVTVLGTADSTFVEHLRAEHSVDPSRCLVIIDIEGGEFDILTPQVLSSLKDSFVIVELHEGVAEATQGLKSIEGGIGPDVDVSFVSTGPRNPSQFPILSDWPDDDRWMLCSEGRASLMRWMILSPQLASTSAQLTSL